MSLTNKKIYEIFIEFPDAENLDFCIAEIEISHGKVLSLKGITKIIKKLIKMRNKFKIQTRKSKGNIGEALMKLDKLEKEFKVPKGYFEGQKIKNKENNFRSELKDEENRKLKVKKC